ncbi:MFS transporter [Haliea sp. E17]|uniref:MFS transporter n=1 Tax=Haliea sp. E17 TaxID=3401576 RepID=UPI003AADB333
MTTTASQYAPAGSGNPPSRERQGLLAFLAVASAACLNAVNGTLIVTAFPTLAASFDLPYAHISALVMYFLAATAASQPIAGALGDLLGRKNVFLAGIVGFCVVSTAAGFSSSYGELIFWRVGQAIFTGTITANAATLIYRIAPEAKIATYLGFLSSAILGTSALAFPLGGLLIHNFEWHLLFWCSVPVGVVSLVLVLLFVPPDRTRSREFSALSLMGLPFIPFAASLQCLIEGRPVTLPVVAFVVTTLVTGLAILRSPGSMQQFSRINNATFNLGSLVALFAAGITFGLMFMLPVWAPATLGMNTAELGTYLAFYTFSMMLASPLSGRHIDLHGDTRSRLVAQLFIVIGMSLLLLPLVRSTFVAAMLLVGASSAICQIIAQRATLLAAPQEVQALAMGIFNTYRSVGCILGNAIPAIIYTLVPHSADAGDHTVIWWLTGTYALPLCFILLWMGRHAARQQVRV